MNSRRLSRIGTVLFFLVVVCVLFIPSSSTGIIEPVRDGDYIYIDDNKAYLKGTYSATHGQNIEHWAMTKQFTGDCDMAIGFNGDVAWPTKVLLDDPHYVYWNTDTSKTFYYVTNFASTTDNQDYGNWYNPLKYKFNHKIIIGYDDITNEPIWQDVIGTVVYFDSQVNDEINYTVTWHTEHSRLEQHRDISHRILSDPIEYEFDGKNLWYITKNIPMTANEMRKIIIEMDGKVALGVQSYKYDIIWKPSHQTIAEAKAAGNLYVLDPYWNISFDVYREIHINNTNGDSVTDYQLKSVNLSSYNINASSARIINSSSNLEESFWNESVDACGNLEYVWCNFSNLLSGNWINSTYRIYYQSTPTASSVSNGSATFDFFDHFDTDKSKWTGDTAQLTISGSTGVFNAGAVAEKWIYSNVDVTLPFIIESSLKHPDTAVNRLTRYGTRTTDDNNHIYLHYDWGINNEIRFKKAGGGRIDHDTNMSVNVVQKQKIVAESTSSVRWYFDDVEGSNSPYTVTANIPTVAMPIAFCIYGTADFELYWVWARQYTANEPEHWTVGGVQYYVDSLHYNASSNYNHTIESDSTLSVNRSIIAADDINDTASSTGITYLQVTQFNNSADIVRNFTTSGDNLDWYQAANLVGLYNLFNSSGIIETKSNGNFTIDLVPGDYWIESFGAPTITLLSQTPSIICQNCTGDVRIVYGITTDSSGLNNTSVSFIYRNYDPLCGCSNHSIRPPTNNLATEWDVDGRILRAANRNETLNFEDNATITGGDTYSWSGLDENSSRLNIEAVNSTYYRVYINGTVHDVMPQAWYLDRSALQEAPKTTVSIYKNHNVLVKFWEFELFKGNTDFLGVGYTDTVLNSNSALWPSDANPVSVYYLNDSYDPATGGDPLTSGFAVYMLSLNASEWIDHVYEPHANSSYVRGFINNSILEQYINTTNISYILYVSETPPSKAFQINVTDVVSSTNVSFANTGVLWTGDTTYTSEPYTPNIWFSFMKDNITFDHKLYVSDNNGLWDNSTLNSTVVGAGLFPPTKPSFYAFHNGFQDFDMNGTYHDTIQVQVSASSDPDGGIVTHNLTLHYGNKTYVDTINSSVVAEDGVYTNISFNTTPYYSQTENYTLRVIATDDEGESVTVWLGVNFSLDGSPRIISYSPETPITSQYESEQTFSITTNLPGNVTWYLDSVEVFNETDVSISNYSNSIATVGPHNVTVIATNINGSNSMEWDWTVILIPNQVPLSIFMGMGGVILIMFASSLMYVGIPAIFTSFLGTMLAFINSAISVNGQLVQNVGGFDSSGSVIQGTTVIEVPALSYLFIFIGLIMAGLTIYHIVKEFKYKKENKYIEVDF